MSTSDLSCVAKRAGNDKRARSTGRGERQEVLRKAVVIFNHDTPE
jgi:hypothetical protein